MSGRNGLSQRIVEWVTANPGRLGREIGAALDFDNGSGLLTYMVQNGTLWRSGPVKFGSFYADADQAYANHERLCAEAKAQRLATKRAGWRRGNVRQIEAMLAYRVEHAERMAAELAERKAATIQRHADQRATLALARSVVGKGVPVLRSVRVTVAATPPPRYAPAPGFERVITGDWQQRMEQR